jgi:hypothetical protein
MSAGESPRAATIVANLDIETPTGDRLSLRGDKGQLTLTAASVGALWRTRRSANALLRSGVSPRVTSCLPVELDVRVGDHVVARVEPTTLGTVQVRLRWLALLRALF